MADILTVAQFATSEGDTIITEVVKESQAESVNGLNVDGNGVAQSYKDHSALDPRIVIAEKDPFRDLLFHYLWTEAHKAGAKVTLYLKLAGQYANEYGNVIYCTINRLKGAPPAIEVTWRQAIEDAICHRGRWERVLEDHVHEDPTRPLWMAHLISGAQDKRSLSELRAIGRIRAVIGDEVPAKVMGIAPA